MRRKADIRRRYTVLATISLMGTIAVTAALTVKPSDGVPVQAAQAPSATIPVTVRTLTPESRRVAIRTQGEVVPLWETILRVQVSGEIASLSDRLQPGNRVKAGERLLTLDKGDYEMQVAEAESQLAQAEVDLFQEEREAVEAKADWRRSGLAGEPASPLVLRTPQLAAARARLAAAKSALANAERRLEYTEIRAPYEGVIIERAVSPGASLFAGDAVATLYSTAAVEVGLHLDAHQWAQLPRRIADIRVRLTDPSGPATWKARVVRRGQRLDREARLRTLFLRVERPLDQRPPLLPGSFVQAEITGKRLANLIAVPQAALTPAGRVWFVDPENRLTARQLRVHFHEQGLAYLQAVGDLPRPIRVAIYPNDGFTDGLGVMALAEDKEF
jgi:RND family efflux transporter MFP subunit